MDSGIPDRNDGSPTLVYNDESRSLGARQGVFSKLPVRQLMGSEPEIDDHLISKLPVRQLITPRRPDLRKFFSKLPVRQLIILHAATNKI